MISFMVVRMAKSMNNANASMGDRTGIQQRVQ
jgi:hypothetical protein